MAQEPRGTEVEREEEPGLERRGLHGLSGVPALTVIGGRAGSISSMPVIRSSESAT